MKSNTFHVFLKKHPSFFARFKKCTTFASAIKQHGRLAQLVQSIWFTPRGSGVRIPQRPQRGSKRTSFLFIYLGETQPSSKWYIMEFTHFWKHYQKTSATPKHIAEVSKTEIVFQKVCKSFLFSSLQIYSFLIK